MLGKPVIKGTRITVELILDKLSKGESIEDILEAHPHLQHIHILAAFSFLKELLNNDIIHPLS